MEDALSVARECAGWVVAGKNTGVAQQQQRPCGNRAVILTERRCLMLTAKVTVTLTIQLPLHWIVALIIFLMGR
jgi:hypothetical protein